MDLMAKPAWAVTKAEVLGSSRLHLTFEDSTSGTVDLSDIVRSGGVFEPLQDPAFFAKARVDKEGGTVVWPNDADLAPEELYRRARQRVRTNAHKVGSHSGASRRSDSDLTATAANNGVRRRTIGPPKRGNLYTRRTSANVRGRKKPGL